AQLVGQDAVLLSGERGAHHLGDQVAVGAQRLDVGAVPFGGLGAVDVERADRAAAEQEGDAGHGTHLGEQVSGQIRPAVVGVQVGAGDLGGIDVGVVARPLARGRLRLLELAASLVGGGDVGQVPGLGD